jgi:thiamine phosphate synthase YjbQ (UPF0047 family)
MTSTPTELTLELRPRARVDLIDVTRRVAEEAGDFFRRHRQALYCSYHTTAGYLDRSLSARLGHRRDCLDPYLKLFQELFPAGADYRHDRLDLRRELSAEQRAQEPRNADSHLAFIGAGLTSCVTYPNRRDRPVFFVDLDGTSPAGSRRRQTTVLGFNRERIVEELFLGVPMSGHPVDSINLKDARLGLFDRLHERLRAHGVARGRVDLALGTDQRHAGLTVNEYETLLMQHDLAEVLRYPFRFMAEKGRHMLADPRAIPEKTIGYAQYDLVRALNRLLDALNVSESLLERVLARLIALPASRFLGMKRSVSLLVSERDGRPTIVQGTYQSPILVQWRKAEGGERRLRVLLTVFE